MADDFRCSLASADDGEPIAGTAPTETDWLFVEQVGPWAAKATGHLASLVGDNGRAQLIRRHGGRASSDGGLRLFRATLGATSTITTALIEDPDHLDSPNTDHDDEPDLIARIAAAHFTPYDGPLWLVCTNGRRDVCCAELGRPVAAALAERWPEATWETTHLGGHRFAATLLALPHAIALGRLDPLAAVRACAALEQGGLDLDVVRGRAGHPAALQAAELHVRVERGWTGLAHVLPLGRDGDVVRLQTREGPHALHVTAERGVPSRQSCADEKVKAAPQWRFGDAPTEWSERLSDRIAD